MTRLEIHTDDDVRVYEILDDRVLIGDVPGADLRLRSSGACVRIARQGDQFVLQAPKGRTVVLNGDRVARHPLRHADEFELGEVRLVFWEAGMDRAPAAENGAPEPPVEAVPDRPLEDPVASIGAAVAESAPVGGGETSDGPTGGSAGLAAVAAEAAGGLGTGSIERRRRGAAGRGSAAGRGGAGRKASKSAGKSVRDSGRSQERAPRSRGRSWWANSGVLLMAVALGVLGWRVWFGQGMGESVPALMQLARNQASNDQFERALATLDQARRMATTDAVRARIDELQAGIEKAVEAADDGPALSAAQVALTELNQFESVYLVRRDRGRPAARELVRRARKWLAEHEAVASRHRISQSSVEEVESMIERYVTRAQLAQPDTAADVLFAAKTRLDLRYRRYPEAERILRGYLAGDPVDADTVRERLAPLDVDGRRWLADQLRAVRDLADRGERESAVERLERLRSDCALPAWSDLFAPFADLKGN